MFVERVARFAGSSLDRGRVVSEDRLERYAQVLVEIALRVEPGDRLLVRSGTHAARLVRQVARHAYRAGAVNVDVLWIDDEIDRARFVDGSPPAADELPYDPLVFDRAAERNDSFLRIVGEAPNRMADVDPDLLGRFMGGVGRAMSEFFAKQVSLGFYWTIAPAPSPEWASLVFPDSPQEEALEALWDAVAATVRIDEPDPLAAWESHLDRLDARMAALDEMAFSAIRYEGPDTDLVVGLPEEHRWNHPGEGSRGRRTVANLPVEEVATTPHRDRADGVIRASKPLSYQGRIIDGFEFRLVNGIVVEATAERGQNDLDRLMETDEGARRLGEVALVPQSSLVARQDLIWFETIFDENDASHLALGMGYPMGIRNGTDLTTEQLAEIGVNNSGIHVDFVVGSRDLTISGIHSDGSKRTLIQNGEWAFEV